MAKFIGISTLFNPAFIVRLFPKANKYGVEEGFAELRDGKIIPTGDTWDGIERWSDDEAGQVIPNMDTTLHAVIYFPRYKDERAKIDRLPIIGWRLPSEWADNSCLIPITICGEFAPSCKDYEITVKTPLGYVSLGHGELYENELEFAIRAEERFAKREEERAKAQAAREAEAATAASRRYAI